MAKDVMVEDLAGCRLCGLQVIDSEELVCHWKRAHNLSPIEAEAMTSGVCLECGHKHDELREVKTPKEELERLLREVTESMGGEFIVIEEDDDDGWPGLYL